ncbi:hypothetical protein [Lelliottia sp. JS-SCA-14]|uniref:hypothetical protein n=1 Tax=Lelliottia sp. JS-SCA-14 TaxID=3110110 RepID=UPI002D7654A8|nr:hypothetical protein [Lelliottia sp. JS-SCA-14]
MIKRNRLTLHSCVISLIIFMGVFNFYIPGVGPALYGAFLLSLFFIVFNIKRLSGNWNLISKAYASFTLKYILPFSLIMALVTFRTLFEGGIDTTYLVSLTKILLFSIVATLFAVCIFISEKVESLSDINRHIYRITLIQSLIIITAILIPSFSEVIKTLQNNDANNSSLVSEGLRGVALSSMQFYALACYFCVVLILLANDFVKKNTSILYTSILLLCIAASSIFISRTAILGVVIFFLFIFNPFSRFSKKRSIILLMIFIGFGCLALLFSFLAFPDQLAVIQEKVLPWAFEIIYKYNDTGGVSTASTDELKGMYFALQEHTFIFGDGLYAGSEEGTYYMATDAGYMRPTLYGGIFLILSMVYVWFYWLKKICILEKSNTLLLALFLLSLALQYKGEFIIVNYCTSIIFVLLLMASFLINAKYNGRVI